MNTKANKVKKILAAIAIAVILLGLTVFGFHFSCRLKAHGGENRTTFSNNRMIQTVNYFQA